MPQLYFSPPNQEVTGSKTSYLTEANSSKEGGVGPGGPKSTFLDQPAPLTKGLRDPPGPNGAPVRDPSSTGLQMGANSVLQLGPVGGLQIGGPTNGIQIGATSGLQMGAVGGLQGGSGRAAPAPPPRGEVGITGSRRESLRDPPLVLPNNPPTRPSLRTESLERPPARERRLREATSGRYSAKLFTFFPFSFFIFFQVQCRTSRVLRRPRTEATRASQIGDQPLGARPEKHRPRHGSQPAPANRVRS